MKNTMKFALVGALLAVAAPVASADCYEVSKLAAKEVAAHPEQVLSILAEQIVANKGCACEIVKAAIVATEADKKQVAQIVEQAIELVPNKVALISTCALAVAPDAYVEILSVVAKYSNKGTGDLAVDESAKGDSSEKAGRRRSFRRSYFNPLNFVGRGSRDIYFRTIRVTSPPVQGGTGGTTTPGSAYTK